MYHCHKAIFGSFLAVTLVSMAADQPVPRERYPYLWWLEDLPPTEAITAALKGLTDEDEYVRVLTAPRLVFDAPKRVIFFVSP